MHLAVSEQANEWVFCLNLWSLTWNALLHCYDSISGVCKEFLDSVTIIKMIMITMFNFLAFKYCILAKVFKC